MKPQYVDILIITENIILKLLTTQHIVLTLKPRYDVMQKVGNNR